jgi:hypothetical protein
VLGLDPGRIDLYVAVDQDDNVYRCSNKEYYDLAGFIRARKKRERWLDANGYIKAIVRSKLQFL